MKRIWFVGIALLVISTIAPIIFLELLQDEAYYAQYAKNLNWGYFDHPSLIALSIKIGVSIFGKTEIGVRLISCILFIISMGLLFRKYAHNLKEVILVLGSPMVLILPFLAIPDTLLFSLSILFYLLLEKYIDQKDESLRVQFSLICTLSLLAALMMWSKYHSILLLFIPSFVLVSFWKKKSFYLILIGTIILYLPHLIWQFNNDFVSVHYHLFDRNLVFESKPSFFQNVLLLPLIMGPAVVYEFVRILRRNEVLQDDSNKIYVYVTIGLIGFFLIFSIFSRVEQHWFTACLPAALLFILRNKTIAVSKTSYIFSWLSYLVFIGLSGLLIFGGLDWTNHPSLKKFRFKKDKIQAISKKADAKVVVFSNDYGLTSLYSFYSNKHATSVANYYGRQNQYKYWLEEECLHTDSILYIPDYRTYDNDHPIISKADTIDFYSFVGYSALQFLDGQVSFLRPEEFNLQIRDKENKSCNYEKGILNKYQLWLLQFRNSKLVEQVFVQDYSGQSSFEYHQEITKPFSNLTANDQIALAIKYRFLPPIVIGEPMIWAPEK